MVSDDEHKITVEELPNHFSELIVDECDNCGRKILAYEAAHRVGRPTWLEDLLSNFMIILPHKTETICHRCWKRENKK